jgi:histidine triad (HIT) family protein
MAGIFAKIAAGEIPSYKVAENQDFLAFLDVFPLTKGHVLVIPKKEVDYVFDLDQETYTGLLEFSKKVAIGLKKAIACKRITMHVVGLEVPHAHVHLIPVNTSNDCNFANAKLQFSKAEFEAIAAAISAYI